MTAFRRFFSDHETSPTKSLNSARRCNRQRAGASCRATCCAGYRQRLERFNQEVLSQQLDVIAKQRIADCAKLVGLKTAVAPTGFLDTAIVLTNAYRLITDLCRIYNVRGNR